MSWIKQELEEIKQELEEIDPLKVEEVDTVPTTQLTTCIPVPVSITHGIFVPSPNVALPPIPKNEVYQPPFPLKRKKEYLDRQSRTVIANVKSYMEMEKKAKTFLIEPSNSQARTMTACGVSRRTVIRISRESKQIQNNLKDGFHRAYRKKNKVAHKTSLDVNDAEACRTLIFKSIMESDRPVDCVMMHKKLVHAKLFTGCLGSVRRLMEKLGFQVKRTRNFAKALQTKGARSMVMEKHESQYKKFVYLRDLKKYQAEGRPVIFTAITTLARAQCKAGNDQLRKGTKILKVTRGMFADEPEELSHEQWRAVLLSAGGKSGFVTSGFLIWRCIKKLGSNSYDENANYKKYVTWVKDNLIPNIPDGAAVVLDHETIYDRYEDPVPTHTSDKEDMKAWLERKGIQFQPDAAKVELFELIRQNRRNHSKFEIDSILEKTGHPVLRTPPNYTELNPMMVMLKVSNVIIFR
ncbi:hypothetical protein GE061_003495 [Apolygus lucorum]|uniref:Uncharacterized protein n=1 Tax=Apolygus lucorum TaxID=248454 RepID=A0A8S9X435_APOLU|nr:hypothetical protein GE061_003495 [Apolygus lucorum]